MDSKWFILIWLPIVSAFVHWVTIWMALKLLFHPKKPINILGYKLQGVFPKRQKQIAENMGKLVGQELLSFADIEKQLSNPNNVKDIIPFVEKHIDDFLNKRLSEAFPIMSMFISNKTIAELKTIFVKELENIFPSLMNQFANNIKSKIDVEQIVVDKISNYSSDKLEEILNQILTRELKVVEIIGTLLGLIIGIVQAFISLKIN